MAEFTKEDVRSWKDDPITQEFFALVSLLIEDADKCVHRCLEDNLLQDAALHNAGMAKLQDVLGILDDLIKNIEVDA